MKDDWEHAAENYHKALDLNAEHANTLYYLGNMDMELGKDREAESCWQKLVTLDPENSRAYLQLASLYLNSAELFDIDKAEQACRQSLEINKEETGPLLLLGEVYLIRGNMDEAAKTFEAVSASNFKSKEAYFLGGYIAWKAGNTERARNLFAQAVKYAGPVKTSHDKVVGEGDTKGFGEVVSKSVFRDLASDLSGIDGEQQGDQAMRQLYTRLDALLKELKRRIP